MDGYDEEEIISKMKIFYGDELYEIVEDVKCPEKIMRYFKWPNDFDCDNCSLEEDCCQFEILGLIKKYKTSIVVQNGPYAFIGVR
jgi:hypothetical protein